MKKYLAAVFSAVLLMFIFSCTGETGPAGPEGEDGTDDSITVVFQEGMHPSAGYDGSSDNFIYESFPDTNFGACGYTTVGTSSGPEIYRTLLRFDLAGQVIPQNVSVTDAYVELEIYGGYSNPGDTTITAYSLATGWVEGTVCSGSEAGSSTWNDAGASAWSTAGGDYDDVSPVSDSVIVEAGSTSGTIRLKLDNAVVASWITNPSSNHGLILAATNEASGPEYTAFCSNEDTVASNRPKLIITYELP